MLSGGITLPDRILSTELASQKHAVPPAHILAAKSKTAAAEGVVESTIDGVKVSLMRDPYVVNAEFIQQLTLQHSPTANEEPGNYRRRSTTPRAGMSQISSIIENNPAYYPDAVSSHCLITWSA